MNDMILYDEELLKFIEELPTYLCFLIVNTLLFNAHYDYIYKRIAKKLGV